MKIAKKKIFREYISSKGLLSTRQREIILDAFLSAARHVSVDELYQVIRATHKKVGHATVYRTLKLFTESGIAREVQFDDGLTRYEYVTEEEHHDHMVCTRCGAVAKFRNAAIVNLQDEISASHGFLIEGHKVELYGLCAQCRVG